MKSFAQYLQEMAVPNLDQGLGKMRHGMPQIKDHDAFVADLQASGHGLTQGSAKAKDLTPTQSNFNEDKVNRMVGAYKSGEMANLKPIVISNDGYVIDGHHRWLACCQLDDKSIDTCQIDMPAEDLLKFLKDKPYVEKRSINEAATWDPHVGWIGGASDEFDIGPNGKPVYYYNVDKHGRNQINHNYDRQMNPRTYMDVKFSDKDKAKAEGMKWDPAKKAWYHTDPYKVKHSHFKPKK